MYLPWPIRPMLEYFRCKPTCAPLKEVGTVAARWDRSNLRLLAPYEDRLSTRDANSLRSISAGSSSKRTDFIQVVGDSDPPNKAGRTVPVSECPIRRLSSDAGLSRA
jgi:hypothetical protein